MPRADGSIIIDTKVNTKGMDTGVRDISSKVSGLGKAFGKLGGAITAAFAVKALVDFAGACIEVGSALDEVQNVVDVTFGEMGSAIEDFSHKAAKQFGLSELAAKQYTSTMGAMLKSMGFTTDAATDMSIKMAGLAADMASFYNLDTDTAFQKIRSGISGETEPLKQLGINLSEANLEQYRLAQGIGVAYNKMTEQSKALLRYNYLLSVTSGAQGDFARTSGSWANQVKILNLQLQEIKANLGQAFINIFLPVLKVINRVLEGLAKVTKAFRNFIELLTGKKGEADTQAQLVDETFDFYDGATEGAYEYADATEDVADATKEANKQTKRYLSGLDEIRRFESDKPISTGSITTPKQTTTPADSGTGTIPTPTVDKQEMSETEDALKGFSDKVDDVFKHIMTGVPPAIKMLQNLYNNGLKKVVSIKWDGADDFVEKIDKLSKIKLDDVLDKLGKLQKALEPFEKNVGEGLKWFLKNVLEPLKSWEGNENITTYLHNLRTKINALGESVKINKGNLEWIIAYVNTLGGLNPGTGVIDYLNALDTCLKNLGNTLTKHQTNIKWVIDFVTTIGTFSGTTNIVTVVIDPFKTAISLLGEAVKNAKSALKWLYDSFLKPLIDWADEKGFVTKFINNVKDSVKALGNVIDTAKKSIKWLWDNFLEPIASRSIGTILEQWQNLNTLVDGISTWVKGFPDKIDALKKSISTKFGGIKTVVDNTWKAIKKGVSTAWTAKKESIKSALSEAVTTVKSAFGTSFSKIVDKVSGVWASVKKGISKAWTAKDSILSAISSALSTVKAKIKEKAEKFPSVVGSAWEGIKTKAETVFGNISSIITGAFKAPTLSSAWNTIKSNLSTAFDTIKTAAENMKKGVSTAFGNMFNGVINLIKPPFNAVARVINSIIKGVVTAINAVTATVNKLSFTVPSWVPGIGGKRFGFNLPKILTYPQIPLLAQGAVIPPNAPFAAILGDQRNGNNIETPEALLRQIVREESGQDNGSYTFIAELDGNVLFKKVIKKAQLQKTQTGHNPFEMAMG